MHEENQRKPIEVEVSMGYTIRTGNFESLRIDVSVRDTQQPGETVKESYERVFGFVNKRLNEKASIVREELESEGGY